MNAPILGLATCVRTSHPEEARRLLTGDRVRETLLVFLHEQSAAQVDETGVSMRIDFLEAERAQAALADALALVRALSGEPEVQTHAVESVAHGGGAQARLPQA